jgi:hypothetical protein
MPFAAGSALSQLFSMSQNAQTAAAASSKQKLLRSCNSRSIKNWSMVASRQRVLLFSTSEKL